MLFARRVFLAAAVMGLLVLPPLYFLEGAIARLMPPAVTHPEFYYGFVGVTIAFQVVYAQVGLAPLRYRPVMPVAALAKGTFVAAVVALAAAGRVPAATALLVAPDLVFVVLFLLAFARTAKRSEAGF